MPKLGGENGALKVRKGYSGHMLDGKICSQTLHCAPHFSARRYDVKSLFGFEGYVGNGLLVQRRKKMLPTPTHFYFSGLTAWFDGNFSHVCFPCFRVFSSGFAARTRPWGRAQRPSRASADAAKDAKVLKSSFLVLGDTKYSPECIMAWK